MISTKILTVKTVRSGQMADYYLDALDDYYNKDDEAFRWDGKGAENLGLSGSIDEQVFKDLLRGRLPDGTVIRTSTRDDLSKRVAIDLTFAPPKSVSIQALVHCDQTVLAAHEAAMDKVTRHIESVAAETRKKVAGVTSIEKTDNLLFAKIRHETSRDLDPQLHTHVLVFNMTQRSDSQWRALVNDKIIKNATLYDAMYISELAAELEMRGFELRAEGDKFELAHITRDQIEQFSSRAASIDQFLAENGLSRETASGPQKNAASQMTRQRKSAIDREKLHGFWLEKAKSLGIDFNMKGIKYENSAIEKSAKKAILQDSVTAAAIREKTTSELADAALSFALNHLTERRSIVGQTQLQITAMQHCLGKITSVDIDAALDRAVSSGSILRGDTVYTRPGDTTSPPETSAEIVQELVQQGLTLSHAKKTVASQILAGQLVALDPRYTTQRAMDMERRILSRELAGRSALPPIMNMSDVHEALDKTTLRTDQRRAVALTLTTENKYLGWQGLAGVGKSFALKHAQELAEKAGYKVVVLAPYGSQVRSLRDDGLEGAQTVAAFVQSSRRERLDDKTIVFVDEAGVLPTRLVDKLSGMVEKEGGRLNLIGDIGQTKAIEEGAPFKLLQRAGMALDVIDQMQRQKTAELAAAVRLAATGKTKEAVALIKDVRVEKGFEDRLQNIAREYVALSQKERDNTLVVTGTNESRRRLNEIIREKLGVSSQVEIESLSRHDSTQEERRFARYFRLGDVIQPEIDYPKTGLSKYQLYRVVSVAANRLTLESATGQLTTISPTSHRRISVYKPRMIPLGVGESIRITRNNPALDLANGDLYRVRAIKEDAIEITNGNRIVDLPRSSSMHIEPGYVTTVHSSQGLTADRVLGNIDTESPTVAKDWFYVMLSRAKYDVSIFTDNLAKLPNAVARESIKHAAIEIDHEVSRKIIERTERFMDKDFSMD